MMSFGDRLAKMDKPIYPANADGSGFAWRRWLGAELVGLTIFFGLYLVLSATVGAGWASVGLGVAAIAFLTWYCIWRRRRNRAMTGSPTTWPAEDFDD